MLLKKDFISDALLIKIISFGPLLSIPLLVFLLTIITINSNESEYQISLITIKNNYINAKKNQTKAEVNMAVKMLDYRLSNAKDLLKRQLKNRVDIAYSVAMNLYQQNIKTENEAYIKKIIKDSLRPLRWNNGNSYIWIGNYATGVVVMMPPKYLQYMEGKSQLDFQDSAGKYIVRDEIKLLKKYGQSYQWDTFTRPNHPKNKLYKQLEYIKSFPYFNWGFGTAAYLDSTLEKMQDKSLDILKYIFSNKDSYFFVIDKDKNIIIDTKNVYKNKNFLQDIITKSNAEKPVSIPYKYIDIKRKSMQDSYTYAQATHQNNWIIVSGFHSQTLKNKIAKKQKEMQKLHDKARKKFIAMSIIIMLFTLSISYYLSFIIKKKLHNYAKEIKNKNSELSIINASLEQRVQERTTELTQLAAQRALLLNELAHRVKNNLQLILGLIWVQKKAKDTTTAESLEILESQIKAIATVHDALGMQKDAKTIEINQYLAEIINSFKSYSLNITLQKTKKIYFESNKIVYLGLIINELMINNLKHSQSSSKAILISVYRKNNKTLICFKDDVNYSDLIEETQRNSYTLPDSGWPMIMELVHQMDAKIQYVNQEIEISFQYELTEESTTEC